MLGKPSLDGCTGAHPFRKAAELSGQPRTHPTFGPPPDAHTLVIQGGAPTELSRSREIVGDRGRSWEIVGALQIEGGAGGGHSA